MAQEAEDQRKKKKTKRIFLKPKKPNGFEESKGNFQKPKKADKEDEEDNDNEEDKDVDVAKVIKTYEDNIAPATQISFELLVGYCNDLSPELVKEAIAKATLANKRNMKYIQGILNDWLNKGFKKLIDVRNEEEEYRKSKQKNNADETEEEKKVRKIKELEEAENGS